jgi:hypothetical protein
MGNTDLFLTLSGGKGERGKEGETGIELEPDLRRRTSVTEKLPRRLSQRYFAKKNSVTPGKCRECTRNPPFIEPDHFSST